MRQTSRRASAFNAVGIVARVSVCTPVYDAADRMGLERITGLRERCGYMAMGATVAFGGFAAASGLSADSKERDASFDVASVRSL